MVVSLHTRLRRHRRLVRWLLAAVAVTAIALSAHSALMPSDMGDHVGDTVAICLTLGGCIAAIGVAAFAVARLAQRPIWRIAAPALPGPAFVPAAGGFPVRAGPPPLLQVFRL